MRDRVLEPALYLGQGLRQLRAPMRVRGQRELPLDLLAGEFQRLDGSLRFWIADLPDDSLRSLALQLFHALLDPRLCVNQTFTGITHLCVSSSNGSLFILNQAIVRMKDEKQKKRPRRASARHGRVRSTRFGYSQFAATIFTALTVSVGAVEEVDTPAPAPDVGVAGVTRPVTSTW